jgi:hypothetical protein
MARQLPHLPLIRSEDQELKLEMARKALRRINSGSAWEDWILVGEALIVVTDFAVAQVNNGPWDKDKNRPAVRLCNQLWDEFQKSEGNNEKPLSSQERTQLRFIMEHPEVEVWRQTLDSTKRRLLNHPNSVVTAWRKATQTPDPKITKAMKAKSDVLVELHSENARLTKELNQAKRDKEWSAPQTLAKLEDAMVAQLDGVGTAAKIDSAKRLLARLGITDISKVLAPQLAPKRKPKPK